jgi:hypothetical protein
LKLAVEKTMQRAAFLMPLLLSAMPLAANAQDGERYRLERTENGFVRMDARTGRMSMCNERSGQLVCADADDDRVADQQRIDDLAARVDALERRIAAIEGGSSGGNTLPSEEEFEQTMGLMERFLRRFMGIVKDLEGETGSQEPAPDRT